MSEIFEGVSTMTVNEIDSEMNTLYTGVIDENNDVIVEKPKKTKKVKKKKSKKDPNSNVSELVEVVTSDTGSTIEVIQQKIISLNEDADSITTQALSNASTSDLTEYQETLVTAIMAIQDATGESQDEEEGVLSSFWNKIGSNIGLVKKVQKSVKEKFIENASLQENIDTIFESLEGSIQSTEKDMTTLSVLQDSLFKSVTLGEELVSEIENMIDSLQDDNKDLMERAKLDGLLRELKSINLVNSNTANQINAQITTTSGLAQNLREVRPILKNLIKSQTLVALQNARMGQAKEVRDLVSGVLNDFVTKNNENTQATILDAIEYSGKTVIHQDTIAELGTQHDKFVKELGHIVKDINKQKLEYNKTVDKVTKQLGNGLKELPRLMVGETSQAPSLPSGNG